MSGRSYSLSYCWNLELCWGLLYANYSIGLDSDSFASQKAENSALLSLRAKLHVRNPFQFMCLG